MVVLLAHSTLFACRKLLRPLSITLCFSSLYDEIRTRAPVDHTQLQIMTRLIKERMGIGMSVPERALVAELKTRNVSEAAVRKAISVMLQVRVAQTPTNKTSVDWQCLAYMPAVDFFLPVSLAGDIHILFSR